MNILTRGLTASAIGIVGLLTIAGCSSNKDVAPVPPQVVVEPAPVVVPERTVTEKTTTYTQPSAPVVTQQTTTTRSVNDSVDNSGPDVAQQKSSSYHSETTTVTPAPVDESTTTTYQKKTYESNY
jgi:hypothetical protein